MVTSREGKRQGLVELGPESSLNKKENLNGLGRQCTLGNALVKVLNAASLLMQSKTGEGPSGIDIPPSHWEVSGKINSA